MGAPTGRESEPPGEVREFVRAAPHLDGMVVSAVGYRSAGVRPALHRGLPSPYLTLIFSLDGPVVSGHTPEQVHGSDAARTDIVVGGLHQRPAYVLQPEHEAGIQLSVHPLAARRLLGMPAGELSDELVVSGADVLGRDACEVHERLCAQGTWSELSLS